MFGTVAMELCRVANVFVARISQKSAFWGLLKCFGWEWKALLMKTKCVSKLFILNTFALDSQIPKIP